MDTEVMEKERNKKNQPQKQERYTEQICSVCFNLFKTKRSDAQYCCNACRQKAYRERGGK